VRAEATKFGRCCDLYQDGFGTFADHECQQRTFSMLRSVQTLFGVDKGGGPLTAEEVSTARSRAVLNNAAPELLSALRELLEAFDTHPDDLDPHEYESIRVSAYGRGHAAIAKATGAAS
jgi:hypothetical protein